MCWDMFRNCKICSLWSHCSTNLSAFLIAPNTLSNWTLINLASLSPYCSPLFCLVSISSPHPHYSSHQLSPHNYIITEFFSLVLVIVSIFLFRLCLLLHGTFALLQSSPLSIIISCTSSTNCSTWCHYHWAHSLDHLPDHLERVLLF